MSRPADIGLLLEGTYPFVRGGVSTWAHDLIRGLPELTFSLCFLGASKKTLGKQAYELPANVVGLRCEFLFDEGDPGGPPVKRVNEPAFADSARLHDALREGGAPPPDAMRRLALTLGTTDGIGARDFFRSERAWEEITARYKQHCTDPSFTDYFWTVRTMHAPLFTLARIARELPEARAWHTISTGYAGFLGALLAQQRKRPLIISEHGIYTKERKIDLAHAQWIKEPPGAEGQGYLRELWSRFFEGLGRMAYQAARPIVSLYQGNRDRQVQDGALQERTQVIPNGIDVERFAKLRPLRPAEPPRVIGLLGRVTPIKDVRTFIRMMRSVCDAMPEAEGWIVGPTEEDPAYARECEELVHTLGLSGKVKFLGFQKPEDILPKLGLLVLTSISEALPLVLLEAMAAGLPSMATDVGACREILEGAGDGLGSAGAVVPLGDAAAAAEAARALLTDPERWQKAQAAGIERVSKHYTRERMLQGYRALYQEAVTWRESASS